MNMPDAPKLSQPLPYGKQWIDDEDLAAVAAVLRGDWLTTGPAVGAFEEAVARRCGAKHGVAVANGTAALHTAYHAVGIGPGDEVLVPAITFAATANAACFLGARPVFVDVDPDTLLMGPEAAQAAITEHTRAVVTVDFAGQPVESATFRSLAEDAGIAYISDACHSLGGSDAGQPVGSLADLTVFSFHPVKPITTGEGGMVVGNDASRDATMRLFRNHGLSSDARERERTGRMLYDMEHIGWNYRLTDVQAALGLSQLRHLDDWTARRQDLARLYTSLLQEVPGVSPLGVRPGASHAYHLFVIRLDSDARVQRDELLAGLRRAGVLANVHYQPVHLLSYYRQLGWNAGDCPMAEAASERIISLPIFPRMDDEDVRDVVRILAYLQSAT